MIKNESVLKWADFSIHREKQLKNNQISEFPINGYKQFTMASNMVTINLL
jgi:hypothetical protein